MREQFAEYLVGFEPNPGLLEADDEPASNFLRAALFESLRKFEPDASLHGFASVRLFGQRYTEPVFDAHAADIFLKLQREIQAAAPADVAEDVQIGFRAISPGSVVLELESFSSDVPPDEQIAASAPSHLETALVQILDLHDAVEAGDELDRLANASGDLITRLRQLVDSLEDADAEIEIDLSRSNGQRRQSRLGEAGRTHARRLFEREPHIQVEVLSGVLASVAISGEFAKIELLDGRRKKEVLQVPSGLAKAIAWDIYVLVQVRTVAIADKFGGQTKTVHEFIKILQHDDPLPTM